MISSRGVKTAAVAVWWSSSAPIATRPAADILGAICYCNWLELFSRELEWLLVLIWVASLSYMRWCMSAGCYMGSSRAIIYSCCYSMLDDSIESLLGWFGKFMQHWLYGMDEEF